MAKARLSHPFRMTVLAVSCGVVLAGCMAGPPMATGPRLVTPSTPGGMAGGDALSGGMVTGDITTAEAACRAAGQERGLNVLGIAGARMATGTDGMPSQDVLLRVARNGAQLEVRCNYQPATGMARIMLI